MLLLNSVSDLIQVQTSAAGSVEVHASWVDNASGTITPGRTNTADITTATTTTVVASPAASTTRNVRHLNIHNESATITNIIDVIHTDGTTTHDLIRCTLLPEESLIFNQEGNWVHLDSNALVKTPPVASGWTDLGGLELSGSAVTTGALSFAAYDLLRISVRVTGYSGSDIASFRFNGDSGANYWSRYISAAAGGVTLTNAQNVSQTLARCFAVATTLQRSGTFLVINNSATSKVGCAAAQTSSGAAATAPVIEWGGFEWVNTSAQITSIELRTAGGANTMTAGTGFSVEGRNLP